MFFFFRCVIEANLLVKILRLGVLAAAEFPKEDEDVGLKKVLEQVVGVGEEACLAVDPSPLQVLPCMGDAARRVLIAPPVISDEAKDLPAEVEAARNGEEVGEAIPARFLVG